MNRQNSSDPRPQKDKHNLKEKEEVQHEYVQKTRQRGREGAGQSGKIISGTLVCVLL